MNRQHPQLVGVSTGSTNTRRHRLRWLGGALALLVLLVATVVLVGVLARSLFFSRGSVSGAPISAPDASDAAALATADVASSEDTTVQASEPAHVRLLMIGDLLMHEGVIYSGEQEDGSLNYDHLFAHIASDIQAADLAILNQETILGGNAFPYSGYPAFNSPQELGEAEAAAGFDVILKATNHTLDMGYAGVREELAYWQQNHPEMAVIGMADPDGDGICPSGTTSAGATYYYEKDGLTVALLNYSYWFNLNIDYDHDYQVVAGMVDEDAIRADLRAARERADVVVVFPHWGNEYETWPSDEERHWAGVFQQEGVDVVIGGHPHVIQPVEVLGEGDSQMLVFWSVGNFVSTMVDAGTMVGGMVTLDFAKDAAGARIDSYEFMPVVCQRVPWSVAETTYKLCDYTDELAATSTIRETDPANGGSAAWYQQYCADVLGEAFDWETLSVHGSLS